MVMETLASARGGSLRVVRPGQETVIGHGAS